jgi:hypothetical protein
LIESPDKGKVKENKSRVRNRHAKNQSEKILMNLHPIISRLVLGSLSVLLIVVSLGTTGCAVYSNGMTLPNPYYMNNRVQYFPRGTEFPFPNEAATLQETQHDNTF